MEPKYKIGDVIKTSLTGESWKFIEDTDWIDIDGDDEEDSGYHYKLRGGEWVPESKITDIMDALPD
jgi:hypothetical protein